MTNIFQRKHLYTRSQRIPTSNFLRKSEYHTVKNYFTHKETTLMNKNSRNKNNRNWLQRFQILELTYSNKITMFTKFQEIKDTLKNSNRKL